MSDRNVRGLLADANLTGHFRYLLQLLEKLDLGVAMGDYCDESRIYVPRART